MQIIGQQHVNWLYINYQLDALVIIYSLNTTLLYMFRALSAHLQEDTVVYMQHMLLSLSMRVPGGLSVHSLSENSSCVLTGHYELWQYHMLHVYNCILLKMSTWGSKHVEENNILWINNNQCIKLVINIYSDNSSNPSGKYMYLLTQWLIPLQFAHTVYLRVFYYYPNKWRQYN